MEGEGIVGDLSLKSFRLIANAIRKLIKGARPLEDGELHFLGSNFMGPGTKIEKYRNVSPLNAPDAVAKQHDIDYYDIGQKYKNEEIDDDERKMLIRKADNNMIRALKDMGKQKGIVESYRKAGLKGIQFKRKLENVSPSFANQLLPPELIGKRRKPQEGGATEQEMYIWYKNANNNYTKKKWGDALLKRYRFIYKNSNDSEKKHEY